MMRGRWRLAPLLLLAACGGAQAATLYVNPAHRSAADSGAGGASEPYKTLAYAVRQLAPGDTLVIAAGVYRDALDLRQAPKLQAAAGGGPDGGQTRIEAAPGARVVIKGSDRVSGWERLPNGMFVRRNWLANTQQVFVDGTALKQIGGSILGGFPERAGHPMAKLHASQGGIWPGRVAGGVNDMSERSFFYDAQAQALYIKFPADTLDGHEVEASVRPYLLIGQGLRNLSVSKLRFEHANTTAVSQSGAISLAGDNLVLEHIDVAYVDGNGFDITGDNNVIRSSSANYCGQVGMKVRGRNARVLDNEVSYNNTRGFNKWWEAGGAKFVGAGGLQDSEVARNRAFFNQGDGIWFDWQNRNNDIHDNVSAYNAGMGIQYEASQAARIHDNYVFGNRQRGIYLPNSSASAVVHNLVVANGMEGIAVIDEPPGKPPANPDFAPRGNRIAGNIVAWNTKAAIVLPSEALDNLSDANLAIDAQEPSFSMGWGSAARPIAKGLESWSKTSGQDRNSWGRKLAMPAQLSADLQAQKIEPDWRALRALAESLRIPREKLPTVPLLGAAPGPKR